MDCDDEEADLLKTVAREFVGRLGRVAINELNDLAEIAEGIGDHASAETWRDIVRAIERLVN